MYLVEEEDIASVLDRAVIHLQRHTADAVRVQAGYPQGFSAVHPAI